MKKVINVEKLVENNRLLRKRLRLTRRVYGILLLICFVVIGVQHFKAQAVQTEVVPKFVEMGNMEKIDEHTFRILPDEEIEDLSSNNLPPLPANLK